MNNYQPLVHTKRAKGFTFTEILIVLAIIAGVTVLVLSQADTAVGSSEISNTQGVIRTFITAANQYRALTGSYTGISADELNNLALLPLSVYDAGKTIIPYNDTDGIQIMSIIGGRAYMISLDFGFMETEAIARQLHEGLGGFENGAFAVEGQGSIHAINGTPADHPTHIVAADLADNRYWAREFE